MVVGRGCDNDDSDDNDDDSPMANAGFCGSLLLSAEIPKRIRARATPSCPLAPENAKYPLPYPLSCTRVYVER